ncbi:hypothetical protein [Maribacter dokdonensis]|uniref:hypothetical protein n=1 Tax=Maribacter dokdonensis TaxID=320912 RepID=UPI0007199B6A|nr:hypothetical protein [Maribacter dokdonensis]KSA12507.1 hypothetical protein I600_3036 [Maribacter dokdonensis DSW-8]
MNFLDKNKYQNQNKTYKRIILDKNRIDGLVVTISSDYIRKITGTLKNDDFYELRNSMAIRLESIYFHYELLLQLHTPGQDKGIREIGPRSVMEVSLKQQFLFDSIIFNAISFFDYLSCFISFILFKTKKSQWQSIANYSRSKVDFNKTDLAKVIDKSDRWLVSKLNQYRSELIHYSSDNVGFSTSFDFKKGQEKIKVYAPPSFTKKFKKEFRNLEKNDLDLNIVLIWLLDTINHETIQILSKIESYIETNRIIENGKEIIKFRNK